MGRTTQPQVSSLSRPPQPQARCSGTPYPLPLPEPLYQCFTHSHPLLAIPTKAMPRGYAHGPAGHVNSRPCHVNSNSSQFLSGGGDLLTPLGTRPGPHPTEAQPGHDKSPSLVWRGCQTGAWGESPVASALQKPAELALHPPLQVSGMAETSGYPKTWWPGTVTPVKGGHSLGALHALHSTFRCLASGQSPSTR